LADPPDLFSVEVILAILINTLAVYVALHSARTSHRPVEEKKTAQQQQPEIVDERPEETVFEEPTKEQILARRAQIIRDIEQERGTKVITLIHRKEPWGNEGPVIEESERILTQLREIPADQPVDLILHTTGASKFAAHMIAMALKFRKSKVTVIIPFYALSNGTLLALAGEEIMMEKYSILGTVEPQFGDMPAASVMSVKTRIPSEIVSDFMILLADRARMETENAKGFVKWLLNGKMGSDQTERVADFLVGGGVTTSTPITLDVVRAMGLKVEQVPEKVYDLFGTMEFGGEKPHSRFN
jgi:ClpP class serine protease